MNDEWFNKIESKIDKIADDVGELKITAVKHDMNLQEHMKRADYLEELYTHLDESKIEPLQTDMNKLKGGYQLLVGLGIVASIVVAFIEWFKH